MSNTEDKANHLKKIYLIIGILVGSITSYVLLYSIFNPKEPKLYAQCFPIDIPMIPNEKGFSEPDHFSVTTSSLSKFRYYMHCKIMNMGDRGATDIELALPHDILSAECKSSVVKVRYDKDVVKIDSLRPETSIEVNIWAQGSAPHYWDTLHMTSNEASGKVYIGEVYYGSTASIARNILFISNNLLIIIIPCLAVIFLLIVAIREQYKYFKNLEREKTKENKEMD